MKRRRRTAGPLVVPILALAGALALAGCTAPDDADRTTTDDSTPADTSDTAGGAESTVKMMNSRFDPMEITVSAGTMVTWTNGDSMSHDVTGQDGDWQSGGGPGGLGPNATFSKEFDEPGAYEYYCTVHSSGAGNGMWGKVIVE